MTGSKQADRNVAAETGVLPTASKLDQELIKLRQFLTGKMGRHSVA